MSTYYDIRQINNDEIQVHWSTTDNLDLGFNSEYAEKTFSFPTMKKALSFVKGTSKPVTAITNSWHGAFGQPVWVRINGVELPFIDTPTIDDIQESGYRLQPDGTVPFIE